MLRICLLLTALVAVWGCSDTASDASLTTTGAGGDAHSNLDGSGDGSQVGDTWVNPGYVPLSTSVTGNWMQRSIGNCIDLEEWLQFLLPDSLARTIVDRNACGPHAVSKVVGNLNVLPGQVLWMQYQDKAAYHLWQRTAAVVENFTSTGATDMQPSYKLGKRALTVMALARKVPGGPFFRKESHETAADKLAPVHTISLTAVQLDVQPPPETAKAGDACTLTLTLAASWEPGAGGSYQTASENLVLPCHYGKADATGWLNVAGDGYAQSAVDSSWSKLFDQKGWWKKYPSPVNQLLFDSFRPVLVQPPGQPGVLIMAASFGWYAEFLNDPPTSVP
jgi:hypothetical protein